MDDSESEGRFWLIIGSFAVALTSLLVSALVGSIAWQQSQRANEAARTALQQQTLAAQKSDELEDRLSDLQDRLRHSDLILIRSRRQTATRFIATLENDGELDAVILKVAMIPGMVELDEADQALQTETSPQADDLPQVQPERFAQRILLDVSGQNPTDSIDLAVPVLIPAGQIINLEVEFSPVAAPGTFYVFTRRRAVRVALVSPDGPIGQNDIGWRDPDVEP